MLLYSSLNYSVMALISTSPLVYDVDYLLFKLTICKILCKIVKMKFEILKYNVQKKMPRVESKC